MFYGDNVQDTRQVFFSSWEKYRLKQPLLPLEQQIVSVIIAHPEYHRMLENKYAMEQSYFPEMGQTNPFLHMGLHLAVRDQIATDRPIGISQLYKQLLIRFGDELTAEHKMIDCLAEYLWQAQRAQQPPDEINYFNKLSDLLNC